MASGRPRKRTEVLGADRLGLLQEVFGSSLHAWRTLGPGCSYSVFRRVWDGKAEGPDVVSGVDRAFRNWAARQLDAILAA